MNDDTDAVGGFFEDLPVLAFVLAGVLSVAATASWTADRLASIDDGNELEMTAERILTVCSVELGGDVEMPTFAAVRSTNLSGALDAAAGGRGYLLSVWALHPSFEPLRSFGSSHWAPTTVRSASMLMNAIDDRGLVAVMEVRALVWRADT